jgi:hypothetical protein
VGTFSGFKRSLTHPVADAWRRPAGLVLAVLAACFVLASAADARTDLAARTRALHTMIGAQSSESALIVGSTSFDRFAGLDEAIPSSALGPKGGPQIADAVDGETPSVYEALAGTGQPLPLKPPADAWASLTAPIYTVDNPAASAIPPHGQGPVIEFFYLQGETSRARLAAGRWPTAVALSAQGRYSVEAALPVSTLKQLGLRVGSTMAATADVAGIPPPPISVLITGAYQPIDPAGQYWQTQPADAASQLTTTTFSQAFDLEGALLGPNELNNLTLIQPFGPGAVTLDWNVPMDLAPLNADDAATLSGALASVLPQAALTLQSEDYRGDQMTFLAPVAGVLAQFGAEQFAGQLETAMPAVGLAVLGLIALLLAARAAVDRQAGETSVLRARGAPLWRLAAAAAGQTALTVVPLTAAGLTIAALIPGESPAGLWRDELVVPLIAVAAPVVLTVLRHRRAVAAAASPAPTPAQARTRRIVLQAALAALCLLGLNQARSQGFSPDGGINLFTAGAPVLAAVLAALVVLNIGPLLLRALLRATSRRRGAVGLLGLARTARTPASAAVTVFILTLVLATADLAVTLHHTTGKEGAAAAAAAAVFRVADLTGQSTFTSPAVYGPDALEGATAGYLALLAALAVAAGCLAVALTAVGDAEERRSTTARLTTMGLTAAQARAITAVELLGPIVLAAVGGTAAAAPLLWTVRPALAQALGGANARITADSLALAPVCMAVLALAAGVAAAAAARRGTTRALRLGD